MAAYLPEADDDLGEFLIDLFAGGKSLDPESKFSEFSQSTRSSALVNLHNQEDIRLFTGIFVLQLFEQRYLLKRRPITRALSSISKFLFFHGIDMKHFLKCLQRL